MMVRQMKEDAKGKSEEELAECFRIFDRCVGSPGSSQAPSSLNLARSARGFWGGGGGVQEGAGSVARAARPCEP